jgi:hypothetical protein
VLSGAGPLEVATRPTSRPDLGSEDRGRRSSMMVLHALHQCGEEEASARCVGLVA